MNLYQTDKKTTDVRKTIVIGVVVFVLIALFAKFGVIDLLTQVSSKEAELAKQQGSSQMFSSALKDYDSTKETYDAYMARYGEGSTDVISVMDMVEQRVMPIATVKEVVVAEDVLTLKVAGASLDAVGSIAKNLESQPLVEHVYVTEATNQKTENQGNVSTLVVVFEGAQTEEE